MEPDYNIDENLVDNLADKAQQASDEYRNQVIAEELAASKQQQQENQALDVQKDPRNADTWDIRGFAKEAQSILSGGLQDTCLLYTSPSPRDS